MAVREAKSKEEKDSGFVKWLSELNKDSGSVAGGKGANLAEMFNNKFPVPPAFAITAQAYSEFIKNISDKMKNILSGLDIEDTSELNKASKEIRQLIDESEMPKGMEEEILEAYEHLSFDETAFEKAQGDALDILNRGKEPVFVAVRSSATTEDLATASFAGQQETFLNVKGKTNLIEKVKKCFSSLFTPRAIYYREKKGFKHEQSYLSVIVQKMINGDKSGVMFSKNPVKEDNNVVIEAVFGLGEGIVSGRIKPDHYVVSAELEIVDKEIAEKKVAITRNSAGKNEIVKLNEEKSKAPVLSDYEIKKLADYAIKLEDHYKKPQDIEFAIDSGNIYIVQTRPITTQTKKAGGEIKGEILLSGLSASPGVASGKVKIIKGIEELNKIQKGDVLVTEMTNPDMVVAMQKSVAIITDEGGVTCIGKGAKVLTEKGIMNIEKVYDLIKQGERPRILSLNSNTLKTEWKRTTNAFTRKTRAWKLEIFDHQRTGDSIIITPDHKMLVLDKLNVQIKLLEESNKLNKNLLTINNIPQISNKFDSYNEKTYYFAGSFLSDGSISFRNNRPIGIRFTQKFIPEKEEFISYVIKIFYELFGYELKDFSSHNFTGFAPRVNEYSCNRKKPAEILFKFRNELSDIILNSNKEEIRQFLAGYLDGDGYFNKEKGWVEMYVDLKKREIIEGIIIGGLLLGIKPRLRKRRNFYTIIFPKSEITYDLISRCKRLRFYPLKQIEEERKISIKDLFDGVKKDFDWKGYLWQYLKKDRFIGVNKLHDYIRDSLLKNKIAQLLEGDVSSIRFRFLEEEDSQVYNLTVEADNDLNHNYIVFSSLYTPIIVGNCHAAIVSREMGIPAVVGTQEATAKLKEGQEVTVDGSHGRVYSGAGETKKTEIKPIEAETKTKIKTMVDLPDFAERAAKSKCKDVGLVRLEGIIASSGKHPMYFVKQKNIKAYTELLFDGLKKIAEPFKEIWIRTSDIRTDEYSTLEGAPKEIEVNPMLGMHGIRVMLKEDKIIRAEFDAVKKIADEHPEKKFGFMFPQIISVEEFEMAKKIAKEEGLDNDNIRLGVMVETPASCEIINELCEAGISFISFGTNDLTQYTLAIDRGNEDVQFLYNEMHPAILKQLADVIKVCKEKNVETSICGQAGSKKEMVEFLVKQGIDSITVNADAAAEIASFVKELEDKIPEEIEEPKEDKEVEKIEEEIKEIEKEEKEIEKEEKVEEFPDMELGFDVFQQQESKEEKPQEIEEEKIENVEEPEETEEEKVEESEEEEIEEKKKDEEKYEDDTLDIF